MVIQRVCSLSVVLVLLLVGFAIARVEEPQMLEGTVVSAGQGALVMKDAEAKQHSFKVEVMTKITFNGKPGKLEDFQAGTPVRVTVGSENRLLAVSTIDDKKLAANL